MKIAVKKTSVLSVILFALPIAACAAAAGAQSTPMAMHSDNSSRSISTNSHAISFDYEYKLKPITIDDHTIIAKHLGDDSRWALLNGNWYDIDLSPHVVPIIANRELIQPDGSHLAKKEPGSKAHRQYEIDMDYYNASLALRAL